MLLISCCELRSPAKSLHFCSKALLLDGIGNGAVQSEGESRVSGGSCHKTHRQASVGMAKLINLNYTLSETIDSVIHTSLKNHLAFDSLTEIKECLAETMPGAAHQVCQDVQGPNPTDHMINGISGLPKGRKSYGNGALIVGRARYYSTEGGQASSRSSVKEVLKPTGSDLLMALRNRNVANKELVNNNLIHIISNLDVLVLAYELIKSNPGNMTKGITSETLDGLNLTSLVKISNLLKAGQWSFSPGRRVWIPKPGKSSKRPLGISSPREKIVQKAIQLVLEAIYEPSFKDCSHGFRPNRGTHTAIRMLDQKFQGASWVIEADISKCFDSIDHDKLLEILTKRISCQKTLGLIKSALKAGYIDMGQWVSAGKKGTPQGNVLSPLLCNVYLNELDEFIMELKTGKDRGKGRRPNPSYNKIRHQIKQCSRGDIKTYRQLRTNLRRTHSLDLMDPNYVRIQYIRYADDFVISIAGPRKLAVEVLNKVKVFLSEKLKLEMSLSKTHITHFTHKPISFLGISILNRGLAKNKPISRRITGLRQRSNIRLSLHAPIPQLLRNMVAGGFMKWNHDGSLCMSTALRRVINLDHATILQYYQSVINGIINYYSFVDNRPKLGIIVQGLKYSCAQTLALKYKLSRRSRAFRKFGGGLKDPETGLQLKIPQTMARTREFKVNPPMAYNVIAQKWYSKLTKSNLYKTCVICGDPAVEMHHVRKLRELKIRRNLDWFTAQMAAINRKQIPLCRPHHNAKHRNELTSQELLAYQAGIQSLLLSKKKKVNITNSLIKVL